MKRLFLGFAMVVVLGLGLRAAEPQALLKFVVVKDYNGKPIRNAGVVMHPVNEKGKQERGGLELKTDAEGKASFDGVPYGKLRVQVLAQGFQTFGEDYDIEQAEMEIVVKLKRPQGQYSIYDDHAGDKKKDDKSQPQDEPKKDSDQKPQGQ